MKNPFAKIKLRMPTRKFKFPKLSIFRRFAPKISLGKMRPFVIGLAFIVAFLEIGFAVAIYGFRSESRTVRAVAEAVPYPIAFANYNIVTYRDYLAEKDYIHHFYTKTEQENIDLAEVDKQILDQLVENKVISYEAWINDVTVSNEDINKTIDSIVEQNGGKEKVEKVLSDLYGLDLNGFRRLVRTQLLRDRINEELITRVTARHILVRVDKDAPEDKVNEAKAKIDAITQEINGGADFAEVAKQKSEDTGSAEQGGLLEPFAKGEMVQEFSDAAFATSVGSISEPIRSEFGWHIIKVESKKGRVDKTFSEWLEDTKTNNVIVKLLQ